MEGFNYSGEWCAIRRLERPVYHEENLSVVTRGKNDLMASHNKYFDKKLKLMEGYKYHFVYLWCGSVFQEMSGLYSPVSEDSTVPQFEAPSPSHR